MDNSPKPVDSLGTTPETDTPDGTASPNVSDPSPRLPSMTGLVETHLMKSSEVRDLLHIGKTTLHDWRTAGRLQGLQHTPGGPWYYPANQPIIEAALRAVGSLR